MADELLNQAGSAPRRVKVSRTQTESLGGGRYRATVYSHPVRMSEDDGRTWKDINPRFLNGVVVDAPYDIRLNGQTLTFTDLVTGKTGSITLAATHVGQLTQDEKSISWGDARIELGIDRVQYQHIIRSPDDPHRVDYTLSGELRIVSDARDVDGSQLCVAASREGDTLTERVTLTDHEGAVAQPRYPIVLDPTLTIQPGNRDTYLNQASATTNYGTQTYLLLRDRSANTRRGLLSFDVSDIPVGSTIDDAQCSLYYYSYGMDNDPTSKRVDLYWLISSRADWVANEATWNVYKTSTSWTAAGGDFQATGDYVSTLGSYGWKVFDVTGLTNTALNTYGIDLSLLLKFHTEGLTSDYSYAYFYAGDYATASYRPKLVVEYTLTNVEVTPAPASCVARTVNPRLLLSTGAAAAVADSLLGDAVQCTISVASAPPPAADIWLRPTGHVDADSQWQDPAQAYDADEDSGAQALEDGHYLELALPAAILCSAVRVKAYHLEVPAPDEPDVDVDIYYAGAWHNLFSGTLYCHDYGPTDEWGMYPVDSYHWHEIAIGSVETVTEARVKANAGHGWMFLTGFQFLQVEGDPINFAAADAGTTDPTVIADMTLEPQAAVAQAGAANPSAILGSVVLSPAPAQAQVTASGPAVVRGSLPLSPAEAFAAAAVAQPLTICGSLSIATTPAAAATAAVNPLVIVPSVQVQLSPAGSTATALDPVAVMGGLTLTATASNTAVTLDPTVLLHYPLRDALKQPTVTPLVRTVLTLGATTLTYNLSRILAAEETMEPYTHTAEVLLDNSDGALTAEDLRGYQVVIGWGATTPAGERYSDSPPLTVVRQELVSEQGALTCRLLCIGIPDKLGEDRASQAYAPSTTDTTMLQSLINAILAGTPACYAHCASVPCQWDSADALATGYKPRDGFRVYRNGSRLAALRKLLDFTACAMRVESDGKLHFLQPVRSGETYDHEFSLEAGSHAFLQKAGRQTLTVPNRIVVTTPEDWPTAYSGTATDATSYALMPATQYQVAAADSNTQAALIAESALDKYRLQSPVARLTVPLAPQVRVLDYIGATDARLGDSVAGNVGLVRHRWAAGGSRKPFVWQTDIELGGWSSVRSLANRLEVYPTPQGYECLNRLSVKDLEAENIRAGNIVLEWLTEAGDVDLSKIGDTLDHMVDGTTYAKLKSTNISAGNILLSSLVQVKTGTSSKWYDVGYIQIDADTGLTIGGQDLIFALDGEEHYIYPSTGELDIMSESGCDIRFLNGPVKLSCDLLPKSNDAYDLGSASYRFADLYCTDLYVTNEPWDQVDDLALVRAIRADAKDSRSYDRTTIPAILKASHHREEKLARHRQRIDHDNEALRTVLYEAAAREARPEKKAQLLARLSRVGQDRDARLAGYAASLNDDSTLSLGNSIGLLFGAVRQMADQVDALTARIEALEKGATE